MNHNGNKLQLVRLGIDTKYEFILYVHSDCFLCKSQGFEANSRVLVSIGQASIIATVDIVRSGILKACEASLSESAWERLEVKEGDYIGLSHVPPVTSLKEVRAKIYGNKIKSAAFDEIVGDIAKGRYSNIQIASFITACATNNLNISEISCLTQAMVKVGDQLKWKYPMMVDKHSVGGLPGNRTTPIVVPIVAAAGLIIPKLSSRSITSPAGTADTLETLTPVDLSEEMVRRVVEEEGGCMAWGGALRLSPADDIIIRVERSLDLDPEGQMIASVLSKKAAVGATHVLIEVPVGPFAKIRSDQTFLRLKEFFVLVGKDLGLEVHVLKTLGDQPIGVGIGPALEARDILQVLNNEKTAPQDLKEKSITVAGAILEMGKKAAYGKGEVLAREILEKGKALKKFLAICKLQGGLRTPPTATFQQDVVAEESGKILWIDNRNLALVAKLAGAPQDPAAGLEFFAKLDTRVEKGQALYRIHAQTRGLLEYSLAYARSMPEIVKIG